MFQQKSVKSDKALRTLKVHLPRLRLDKETPIGRQKKWSTMQQVPLFPHRSDGLMFSKDMVKETFDICLPDVVLVNPNKSYDIGEVIKIQRCWQSYQDRKIYKDMRSLIHRYERLNPQRVLQEVNRCEAPLVDKAAGLHVRLRLSGFSFPPSIVYKVYTHRPIVDLGAFSPRQYAEGPRKCKGRDLLLLYMCKLSSRVSSNLLHECFHYKWFVALDLPFLSWKKT